MKHTLSRTRGQRPAHRAARATLGLLSLLPVLAVADVSLYQAVVPLNGMTEGDRAAGFGDALRAAAVRASGRKEAAANPVIASAAADAARYVQQYSTTSDRMLKVGFDGRGVEQLLQQAGLPLWPAERPATLVCVFLPSIAGGARAVMASERPPERDQIERAAQARGLPLAWPTQALDGAAAREKVAAPGTASQAVLLGVTTGGQIAWSFAHLDARAQGQGSAAAGADLAADTLATRYAPASTRSLNSVPVRVGGITDVQAYAGLLEYLQTLSLVRSVAVDEAAGSTVRLELGLRGDLELLKRIAALDTHLTAGARPDAATGEQGADFTWQP
ncbi:MAG TPA: DUF2066 domain-containing protein [Steroidobacteraceae bacterium]